MKTTQLRISTPTGATAPRFREIQAFTFALPPLVNPVTPGDLNGDGKVDIKDATLSLSIAVGTKTAVGDQLKSGDFNGDGKLDLKDTTLILKKAVGG